MSSALMKLATPSLDSDKYDCLSNLLLKTSSSASASSTPCMSDNELDIHFDVTFDNDGNVSNIIE